jgi:archaellum biogenesis ATPase FlaH
MNIEKLVLAEMFNSKSVEFLSKVKSDYFSRPIPKTIYNALQSYVHTFHTIPDLGIFKEKLKAKLPEDKKEIYMGYLDGLALVPKEYSKDELLSTLKDHHTVNVLDKNIEALVLASKVRDVNAIKTILSKTTSDISTESKMPDDITTIEYYPNNIKLIEPFLPTMRKFMKFGGLTVIGGASGAGKSNLGLNQLLYSYKKGHDVCLLNLELGLDETISRMYSIESKQPFAGVYGNKDPKVVEKINDWKKEFFDRENKFYIKTTSFDDIEIENIITSMAAKGVSVFLLDYLNLIEMSTEEDWKGLSRLIKKLHRLTQELGIVIITPTQVNMSDTKEKDGELKVSTRGSKELEFSSTVFLFIYQTPEEKAEGTARIFTLKSRNSEKKTYVVVPNFSVMSFTDTHMVL